MNRYEGKTFENQHLVLDDGVFINCTFRNCSLEYSGGDVYVQNCQGDGCQLIWRGAAQRLPSARPRSHDASRAASCRQSSGSRSITIAARLAEHPALVVFCDYLLD